MCRAVEDWREFMRDVLSEMARVLKPRGRAVVEVGEVSSGKEMLNLDELVAEEARNVASGKKRLVVEEVLVNQQEFTKLSNCFNVENNRKGTNTNRLVVLQAVQSLRSVKR